MSIEDKNDYISNIINRLYKCHELLELQSSCITDEYMKGMYNGMELVLAMLEDREPVYIGEVSISDKRKSK